jgi:hypothetical protein
MSIKDKNESVVEFSLSQHLDSQVICKFESGGLVYKIIFSDIYEAMFMPWLEGECHRTQVWPEFVARWSECRPPWRGYTSQDVAVEPALLVVMDAFIQSGYEPDLSRISGAERVQTVVRVLRDFFRECAQTNSVLFVEREP